MANLENIKVGDKVVWGTWDYRANAERKTAIHTVTKVTSKKFATNGWRDLYSKDSGKSYAASQYMYHRVASAAECEQWDAAQERLLQEREIQATRQKERDNLRQELISLFKSPVRVDDNPETDKWDVTLHGLTEEEVRQLAVKLNVETDQ